MTESTEVPAAAVFPDIEAAVGGYLAARPELAGVPVGPARPAAFDGTTPLVVLIRDGGGYREDEILDEGWLRIETYGPSVTAAHTLLRTVRALLPGLTRTQFSGFTVADVTEDEGLRGLRRLTDRNHPEFTRYCLNVRLLIHLQ
ncbi:hypothetical protein [Actinomadura rayongensis]|uniref:DUF3168 domain-containing protein n=1 Tax=Actinomadura rayongensis TaxID=1429076 RepID=A0A6I4W039_9ACTN|nr:hypothetical protein [Actinomadura rayongensis]MXQ63949.1 hypothetical protein [Actinomadura rayongensis]